jgi:hypothetical protein
LASSVGKTKSAPAFDPPTGPPGSGWPGPEPAHAPLAGAAYEIRAHGDQYNGGRNGAVQRQLTPMSTYEIDGLLDFERKFVGLQFFRVILPATTKPQQGKQG